MTAGFWGTPGQLYSCPGCGLAHYFHCIGEQCLVHRGRFGFSRRRGRVPLLLALLFFCSGSSLKRALSGSSVTWPGYRSHLTAFVSYSKRFWQRMLGLRLLILVFTAILGTLAMLLPVIGIIAFGHLFVLRVKFIYWEYTMVSKILASLRPSAAAGKLREAHAAIARYCHWHCAAKLHRRLFSQYALESQVIFISIPFYCYLATALQLALMGNKLELDDAAPEFAAE